MQLERLKTKANGHKLNGFTIEDIGDDSEGRKWKWNNKTTIRTEVVVDLPSIEDSRDGGRIWTVLLEQWKKVLLYESGPDSLDVLEINRQ